MPRPAEEALRLLDDDRLPAVPEFGSLGCSGDLAPLAHVAAGLALPLAAKEGLALINGTSGMVGLGTVVYDKARRLLEKYLLISALSIEGLASNIRNEQEAILAKLIDSTPDAITTS